MIDEEAFRQAYNALRARVAYLEVASGLFVPDDYLDTRKGDPAVPFWPKNWKAPSMKGKAFSLCSPEVLESLAAMLTRMANKPQEGKEEYAPANRRMAAIARTWARRLRRRQAEQARAANTNAAEADEEYLR